MFEGSRAGSRWLRAIALGLLCLGAACQSGGGSSDNALTGGVTLSDTGLFLVHGVAGGPFSVMSKQVTLENEGATPAVWEAFVTEPWLELSPAEGTLQPGESVNVLIELTPAAVNALAPNVYSADAVFSIVDAPEDLVLGVRLTVLPPASELSVAPPEDLFSSGPVGGPFAPTTKTYGLTNTGSTSLQWAVLFSAPGVGTLGASSGTLAPGGNTSVTLAIDPTTASSLPPGNYGVQASFVDALSTAVLAARIVHLTVEPPVVDLNVSPPDDFVADGLVGGPFTPDSATYTLANSGTAPFPWSIAVSAPWVRVAGPTSGTLAVGNSVNKQIELVLGSVAALAAGNYSATVDFKHAMSGLVIESREVELSVDDTSVVAGWTEFNASPDTRIVYVSSSTGSNSFNGLSENTPKQTIAAGKALMRHGFPDWLLLKKGDTFTENFGQWKTGGRSPTERQLISSYGPAGAARPLVRTGSSSGIFTNLGGSSPTALDHIALVGIEMHPHTSSGASEGNGVQWLVRSDDFLIEDCMIRGYFTNLVVQGASGARITNFQLRRSVIADAYTVASGHAQGVYISGCDGALIEECVIDRNGWNTSIAGSVGTIFRHNVYIQDDNTGVVFRGNIVNGTDGVQIRPGGSATDNLFTRTAIALLAKGNGIGSAAQAVDVRRNVILDGANIGPGLPRGWGLNVEEVASGTIAHNLIANNSIGSDPRPLSLDGTILTGIKNLSLHDNVVANWGGSVRFVGNTTQLSNIDFSSNDVKNGVTGSYLVEHSNSASATAMTSANNRFFSANAPSGSWMQVSGANHSISSWKSLVGDTTSFSQGFQYPDPSRSTASYNASVGGANSHDAFITEARKQSKANWRVQYTADAVNDYIRAGFGLDVD